LRGSWTANVDWTVQLGHPIFILLLFSGSSLLFGSEGVIPLFPWLDANVGALRLVSVVFGTATCLIAYYLVKEITHRQDAAIFSCILLAFDPISVGESSYGILDPGMTFFYLASILFLYKYIKERKGRDLYCSAVLFGLSVASKYFAFIAFPLFIGILLWKRELGKEWKSLVVFLCIGVLVFFIVQPYLWSNPLLPISETWKGLAYRLPGGHPVKVPGNPFLISTPDVRFGTDQNLASKPDFFTSWSEACQSPWWYIFYIQTMYSTPFQMLIYPYAAFKIIESVFKRRTTDLTMMGSILPLVPSMLFVFLTVRLPQYAILSSTSFIILGAVAFHNLDSRNEKRFLALLLTLHVGWVLYALATPGNSTGWGFYVTPLTHFLADFFHLMWKLAPTATLA